MPTMNPVSADEMAAIQAEAVAAACDKVCQIYRVTGQARDAFGSRVPTYTLIKTTVAGMTQPTAGQLQNYDYLIGSLAAWQVRMPIGIDVTHQDHLVIEGQTLEVHVLLNPQSYSAFTNVIAAEIK